MADGTRIQKSTWYVNDLTASPPAEEEYCTDTSAPGKNGRPLTVFANMYPVQIKPGQTVWWVRAVMIGLRKSADHSRHYTTDIDPIVKVAKQK